MRPVPVGGAPRAGRCASRSWSTRRTSELDAIVAALDPDLLQLHGAETPERVAAIRARFGRPVMKAIGIAEAADLAAVGRYAGGRRPPPPRRQAAADAAALPGGNGLAFDWRLARRA